MLTPSGGRRGPGRPSRSLLREGPRAAGIGQAIADSSYGDEETGVRRIAFELPADMPDVDAKIVLAVFEAGTPHGTQEVLVAAGSPAVVEQHLEQAVFGGSQRNVRPVVIHSAI